MRRLFFVVSFFFSSLQAMEETISFKCTDKEESFAVKEAIAKKFDLGIRADIGIRELSLKNIDVLNGENDAIPLNEEVTSSALRHIVAFYDAGESAIYFKGLIEEDIYEVIKAAHYLGYKEAYESALKVYINEECENYSEMDRRVRRLTQTGLYDVDYAKKTLLQKTVIEHGQEDTMSLKGYILNNIPVRSLRLPHELGIVDTIQKYIFGRKEEKTVLKISPSGSYVVMYIYALDKLCLYNVHAKNFQLFNCFTQGLPRDTPAAIILSQLNIVFNHDESLWGYNFINSDGSFDNHRFVMRNTITSEKHFIIDALIEPLHFSHDGNFFVFKSFGKNLIVWNLKTNTKEYECDNHRYCEDGVFLKDGLLVCRSCKHSFDIVDLYEGSRSKRHFSMPDYTTHKKVYVSPDGKKLVFYNKCELYHTYKSKSGIKDGVVIYDIKTQKDFFIEGRFVQLAFSPDSTFVLILNYLCLWYKIDLASGKMSKLPTINSELPTLLHTSFEPLFKTQKNTCLPILFWKKGPYSRSKELYFIDLMRNKSKKIDTIRLCDFDDYIVSDNDKFFVKKSDQEVSLYGPIIYPWRLKKDLKTLSLAQVYFLKKLYLSSQRISLPSYRLPSGKIVREFIYESLPVTLQEKFSDKVKFEVHKIAHFHNGVKRATYENSACLEMHKRFDRLFSESSDTLLNIKRLQ